MSHRDDPRQKYDRERDRLKDDYEGGTIDEDGYQSICTALDAYDPSERSPTARHDGEVVELASNSLQVYTRRLRIVAGEVVPSILELDQDDVNALMDDLEDGSAAAGPSDGYADSTMGQFASALIALYRYHDGHDVDPEAIDVPAQSSSSVDDRDLWDLEEVTALRSVIDSKRNEALFELLAYSGQRIRVVQTLRVKDVDPDKGSSGRYYVNEEVEGRKNREGHGPLLGAQGPVRRWLQVHPTGKPEDALITCQPDWSGNAEPGDRITQGNIRNTLRRIADRAGVDKKINPHMFRHYFTTIALRPKERGGFGMDPEYVKRLRGDGPNSNVMQTTYAHLIDEDASAHAETAFTGEEPDRENALTPAAPCQVCGEMLQAGDAACVNCGAGRKPGAERSDGLAALLPYLGDLDDEQLGRVIRQHVESQAGGPMGERSGVGDHR